MEHVHDQARDHYTQQIFITCYCYCDECFSATIRVGGGNGCICPECFCREVSLSKRRLPSQYYRDPAEAPKRHVENIVKGLPETIPGSKSGVCRTCGKPTFRQGSRGRFPVLCKGCK
jgi:hypothetical protein